MLNVHSLAEDRRERNKIQNNIDGVQIEKTGNELSAFFLARKDRQIH